MTLDLTAISGRTQARDLSRRSSLTEPERLNSFKPKCQHITISLHESFQAQSTSWAILPEMKFRRVYIPLEPGKLNGKVAQVCWGLIETVVYFHKFRNRLWEQ
jgi:hypothetical protein